MEDTLDAIAVADGDLNVRPFMKSAVGIDRITFEEHATHGVKGWDDPLFWRHAFNRGMKMLDYGTIQKPQEPVRIGHSYRVAVFRQRQAGSFLLSAE